MKKRKFFDFSDYRMCGNCMYAKALPDDDLILCVKHGLKKSDNECRNFEIDLLSVRPKKLRTFKSNLSEEDFKL